MESVDTAYKSKTDDCRIIELSQHHEPSGNLTVVEDYNEVPFDIRRVYYLYDVPGGTERGGHAHKCLYQLIVAVSGSFDVVIDDGSGKKVISMNRPYYGLLIVPGIWRELRNFSSGAVTLVLASDVYDEEDYIRDYRDFCSFKGLSCKDDTCNSPNPKL